MAGKRMKSLHAGDRAPDFELELLGGGHASLQELLRDGPVLLAFFKISCPVCQLTFPYLQRIHASGGLRVVGVSQNIAEDTADFNRAFGVEFPTLLDPEDGFPVSNAYGITNVPTSFLIEPDGVISSVSHGWNRAEVEAFGARAGAQAIRPGDVVPAWKAG